MSFGQQIPKLISDKISNYLENNKEKDGKKGEVQWQNQSVKAMLTKIRAAMRKTKPKLSTIPIKHNFIGD
jgi:hypothetical protein